MKSKEVFYNIFGKIIFKQQSYNSGLGDLTSSIMSFSINEDNFPQVQLVHKGHLLKVHRYTIVYYIIFNYGSLIKSSPILEDLF